MSITKSTFAERRTEFLRRMGEGVAVFFATPVHIRNNDVEHEYRQDSDFFYLTGFDEPGSVLVLSNSHPEHRYVLFVRERDKEREIWDGRRAGTEGAVKDFGADAAFPVRRFGALLPDYLQDAPSLYARLGSHEAHDKRILGGIQAVKRRARQRVHPPRAIIDPGPIVHEMRMVKSDDEIAAMRAACEITRDAHKAAMKATKPGDFEYQVEAVIQQVYRENGCERAAYGSIVGSGPNATILHYRKNNRKMEDGDLLLIDAGCELDYYASDVTRTFPVNGKFSDAQREIYDLVLKSQLAGIEISKPGTTFDQVHEVVARVISDGLVDLGLISGDKDEAFAAEAYKAFYMHKTGHWLGMDVHDVGAYYIGRDSRTLAPGHVMTIEPGIYIAEDADVAPKYRGIGIRIEDDILITEGGCRNLTEDIPKTAEDIEAWMAS